jgi:hypothetical protein
MRERLWQGVRTLVTPLMKCLLGIGVAAVIAPQTAFAQDIP